MFLLLKGSTHDSTILKEQLIDIHNKHPQIFNQTNILIADGAYDSIPLRKLIEELNLDIFSYYLILLPYFFGFSDSPHFFGGFWYPHILYNDTIFL